jgi:hypothetical protein
MPNAGATHHGAALQVLDAFSRLSADSVMKRFFGIKAELTEADLRDFTEPAPDDYSIVITVPSTATPQGERIVGIGQFFRCVTGIQYLRVTGP